MQGKRSFESEFELESNRIKSMLKITKNQAEYYRGYLEGLQKAKELFNEFK